MSSANTALMTGTSAGIGADYADSLARRGHDLILAARDKTRLNTPAERLPDETGRSVDVLVAELSCGRICSGSNTGSARAALPKKQAHNLLADLVALITTNLQAGARIRMSGLGTLEMKMRESQPAAILQQVRPSRSRSARK